jgi:hypothetical protein
MKIELPPLQPGEEFFHELVWDEDGELEGVRMRFQNQSHKIEEIVDVDLAYAAKFDLLRTTAERLLKELRKGTKEKS